MPLYEFQCDECGHVTGIVASMKDFPRTAACESCGSAETTRLFGFQDGNIEYAQPLVSQSLAMNPEQIGEHRRLFPDVQVTPDGCPVFTNFSQHEAYLKKTGFQKLPGKRKAKSHRNVTRTTASNIKQELQERKANA